MREYEKCLRLHVHQVLTHGKGRQRSSSRLKLGCPAPADHPTAPSSTMSGTEARDTAADDRSVATSPDREEAQPIAAEHNPAMATPAAAQTGAAPEYSPLLAGIAKLKEEQKQLKEERKRVAKLLKNQEKKRQRLKAKAKQLTDEDLLQVLNLRAVAKAELAQRPSEARSSAPSPPEVRDSNSA